MKKYRTGIIGPVHLNSHLYSFSLPLCSSKHPLIEALMSTRATKSAVPNIELVAAVAHTDNEKKPFQQYGISKFYENYEEMLDREDLDIFEIDAEPNRRHEMTLAAAKRGIHVLLEKPIAVGLKEADEMIEACDKAGVQFAVHNPNFSFRKKSLIKINKRNPY